MRELGRNGSKSRKDCGGQRENGRREGGPAARCPVPGCDSGETWDDSCGGKGTASTRPTVPPRDAGEAERGWLVASSALGRPVRSPQAPGLRYLVCWLESCASLTRLCTSVSVLSLVPERSFSAPICSRTAERCSAVHFRTKGFRWLKGNAVTVRSSVKEQGAGGPTLPHVDLQLCIHVSQGDGL